MGKDTKKASKDKPKKGDKGSKGGKGGKGKKKQPNLDKVVARLHEALVTQNWAEYHSLFHPSFARYVGGVFNENLLDELTISQSMELLFKHGTFLKLDVSKVDVVGPGNGYFRLHWQYLVTGSHVVHENTHLLQIRTDEQGIITFWDSYFDSAPVEEVRALLNARIASVGK